ncbi:MAG: glycosyl transferase family 8 [Acidobacteria bacterium]|nr:glycosyl transferase family 8 [Acidobacteriota bacterium]
MIEQTAKLPECCVVYTTDPKYLFPTLVSAMQARFHASRSKADVIICCFGLDEETERIFAPICRQEQIGLQPVDSSLIENQTSMLARLFLNRFVPQQYTQYLYLDGDVHILDSIDPLIDAAVPDGQFLAANDPMTFLLADSSPQSRDLSRHLLSIGLTHEQSLRYFNSGVLRINRVGWDETGSAAWEQFRSSAQGNRFPDQDALNIVSVNKRLPLSLAWNYPVFMSNSRVESRIRPRIKHFMSSPKPWNGAFPPWTQEECIPYRDALTRHPSLEPFNIRMSVRSRMAYHFQQHGKRLVEKVTWGWSQRRTRILHYEANCNRSSIILAKP